ncbi:MAG: hypothetical protein LBF28_01405 [Rickettsiales bacterium]|jgi:deoxycytidylate deaminase|nr:hypothetical protein [Rickettsiales bacterium]
MTKLFDHFTSDDHERFMQEAYNMKRFSHDLRTQTGAVIVEPKNMKIIGRGTNRLPIDLTQESIKSFNDPEFLKFFNLKYKLDVLPNDISTDDGLQKFLNSEIKYIAFQHAERGAIANAAKNGKSTKNCVMYATYYPCAPCASSIIEAGIKLLAVPEQPDFSHTKWGLDWKLAEKLLAQAKLETLFLNR